MKNFIAALVVAAVGVVSVGAQEPQLRFRIGTPLTMLWDAYTAQEIQESGADRYEIAVDGVLAASVPLSQTSFAIPALPLGPHSISVKGCNPAECSLPASLDFHIVPVIPPTPRNPRIVPGDAAISVEQAGLMAHAYSQLLQLRPLTPSEMNFLSARYVQSGPRELTRLGILAFLDEVAAEAAMP